MADAYFDAVLPELEPGDECIVVDNGSIPPLTFGTIRVEENLGFSRGSNLGLRSTSCDAILFLNNDIALERSGWLREFRDAVAPGVLAGHLRYDQHATVDGVSFPYLDGWCLCGMRTDLLELGGFDDTLDEPAYYSDNLLSLEARAAGMRLRQVRPGIRHLENRTAGPAADQTVRQATAANRDRYVARVRELLVAA